MRNNTSVKSQSIIYTVFLSITCFISNISQIPIFFDNFIIKSVVSVSWLALFVIAIMGSRFSLGTSIILPILMCFTFSLFVMLADIATNGLYLSSSMIYPLAVSMMVLLTGYSIAPKINEDQFKYVALFYVIGTLITSVFIFDFAFARDFGWDTRGYLYASKNSISQMIFTALLFLYFMYSPNYKIQVLFKWSLLSIWTIFLLMLKSRATILGIPLVLFVILFLSKINYRTKAILLFLIAAFAIALAISQNISDFIMNNIILAGRDINDLADVTSSRTEHFQRFLSMFPESPFFGVGTYYLESFPLAALMQYGIIGALPLFLIVLHPLFWAISRMPKANGLNMAFFCITIVYLFNGLAEELAPIGPGVKCYMLWLLFGLLLRWQNCHSYRK